MSEIPDPAKNPQEQLTNQEAFNEFIKPQLDASPTYDGPAPVLPLSGEPLDLPTKSAPVIENPIPRAVDSPTIEATPTKESQLKR